jgi:NRAMP (natural resistance-associated macrophage protein)-like metal ion transporter
LMIFGAVLGPGIITMVADNDAGGISTYSVTGSKFGFNLLWIFIILIPMAYYVQEMTVRLGAVTKRGHAEAIFDGFGPFWGWFSLFDLGVVNWLTLITEYIGMMAAWSIFGINPIITFAVVTVILMAVVMTGKYWTFEKLTLAFVIFNFVYIPAAIWSMHLPTAPGWGTVARGFYAPHFPNGISPDLIFIIMACIGTTITPWQIFFQQSAVVDKGVDIHDVKYGKLDTFTGSFLTGVVAVFIIIATGAAIITSLKLSCRTRRKPPGLWSRSCPIRKDNGLDCYSPSVYLMPGSWGRFASPFRLPGLSARFSDGRIRLIRASGTPPLFTWSIF